MLGVAVAGFFYVSGIVFAVDAVMTVRTSQGSIAWIVSLLTFPYVAVPLYWVFGRTKYHGYIDARRTENKDMQPIIDRVVPELPNFVVHLKEGHMNFRVMEELAAMPFTRYNDADLLVDGKQTFDAIFEAIESAQDYVLVQFFIIKDDELGREFQAALVKKARLGVRVHLLYDEIGCIRLPGSYLRELTDAGVHVSPFNTTKGIRNRFQLNFRNHRKVVIVDGRAAFTGGLNVGDEYMGRGKEFGPWRDTYICVRGPCVQAVQFAFIEDWYWATHEVPDVNWSPKRSHSGDKNVLVIPSGPADDLETCGLFFLHAIHSAKHRVWIASPYFVPDPKVVAALQIAALRGVDVRILLPERADHVLVWLSSFSYYSETRPYGVRLFRYQPGFLHEKVMLVDDDVSAVGTANLDNRSFRLNFEITLLVVDEEFGARVKTMLEQDFDNARLVEQEELDAQSVWFKFGVGVARLMAPIQ
ncbi:MAG: cardiolipin synthase [Gammaproteobacteria bacterium]|nr:cardiolipin synthase [Gammaproteobacteria bacterium]